MKDVKLLDKVYVMSPRNLVAVSFINESITNLKKAFKRGEESRVNPQFSLRNKCPHCGNRKYFLLYGGQDNKRCADCGEAY